MHVICLSLLLLAADAPERWPGFLGVGATELQAKSLPLTWSPDKQIAWQAKLPGHGQSSPVVWGDTVVVTSVEGDNKETYHVVALSLSSGKELWRREVKSTSPVENSLYVSRAAPTPVTDGQSVFIFFESGDVAAFSLAGEPLWNRSLASDYGKFQNKFGLSASPVLTSEAMIILVDDEGPSYLVALSKTDGQPLWKVERESRTSWSSPALVKIGDSSQLVISSAGSVDGYDPASGKQLWSYDDVGSNTAATPLAFDGGKFLVGASAGREAERAQDASKSNLAMTIDFADGKFTPRVLWNTTQATPSFGSPIVHNGLAYWVNRQGVVYCLDAKTGEAKYTERTKQSIWATPLAVDDRIYLFGKDGLTTVLAAGPEFKVLAENQLWDPEKIQPDPKAGANESTPERQRAAANFSGPTQYGIAAVNGSLLIRTGDVLYCVRK